MESSGGIEQQTNKRNWLAGKAFAATLPSQQRRRLRCPTRARTSSPAVGKKLTGQSAANFDPLRSVSVGYFLCFVKLIGFACNSRLPVGAKGGNMSVRERSGSDSRVSLLRQNRNSLLSYRSEFWFDDR